MARTNREVGDLREDTDRSFLRLEQELDNLSGEQIVTVLPVATTTPVTADVRQLVRIDTTIQPIVVQLPLIGSTNAGVGLEVKVVTPGTPGTGLLNLVHLYPSIGNTIDGQSSFVLQTKRSSVVVRSDGSLDWVITSAYLPILGTGVDDLQTDIVAVSTNGQVFFSLTQTPADLADVKMSVNGQPQTYGVDFTVAGQSVTWQNASFTLEIGDTVEFTYHF